jgi:hypothetical protein
MLENAVRICDAAFGNIYRWDDRAFSLLATHNTPPAFVEYRTRSPNILPDPGTAFEDAEQARIKAMECQNGAAAAVSAITAKAKLAGLWQEKIDQHSTGTISTVWQVSWEDEKDGGGSDE